MSIIRLSGGLGNQLFQVALAIAISKSTGCSVGLDTTLYRLSIHGNSRHLEVNDFKSEHFYFYDSTPLTTIFGKRILPKKLFNKYIQIITRGKKKQLQMTHLPIQVEGNTIYDPELDFKTDSYLIGSFTSPEYWGEHAEEVLATVRSLFVGHFSSLKNCFDTELAIHIRRGDYVTNDKARNFHGICGLGYYIAAVRQMVEVYPDINSIQIFSDDDSVADEFRKLLESDSRIVRINRNNNAPTALAEMSCSKYFIGCNSTFSWWASVLNPNRHSTLPSKWFLDPSRIIDIEKFFIGDIQVFENDLE